MREGFLMWTYSGVDFQLAGNGGEKCAVFLPTSQRLAETFVMVVVSFLEMYLSFHRLVLSKDHQKSSMVVGNSQGVNHRQRGDLGRRILLVLLCLVFGVELGFKFATRQLIWLLNPCHVVTIIQIFILTAPPSRTIQAIFRIHVHLLSGATIALVFPVVNTRLLTFESEVYFIQHGLMLVIPAYLMSVGGIYTVESLTNPHWVIFSLGLKMLYHFAFLQFVGQVSLVNLNSMLCPAVSDPFYGPYYRTYACIHQTALILIHGKIYTFLIHLVLRLPWPRDAPHIENCTSNSACDCTDSCTNNCSSSCANSIISSCTKSCTNICANGCTNCSSASCMAQNQDNIGALLDLAQDRNQSDNNSVETKSTNCSKEEERSTPNKNGRIKKIE